MQDAGGLPRDTDAVIATLAPPVIAALTQAAERRQPLAAVNVAALERDARLRLGRLIAALRLELIAAQDRASQDRAVWDAIDLPQALREAVHAARADAGAGEAS